MTSDPSVCKYMAGPPEPASPHLSAFRRRGIFRVNCLVYPAPYPAQDWELTASRPFLFILTVVVALLVMMGESPKPIPEYITYSTVTGYFQQDDPATEDHGFDYVSTLSFVDLQSLILPRQLQISVSLTDHTMETRNSIQTTRKPNGNVLRTK